MTSFSVAGVYFDGRTSRRQDVHAELGDGVRIVAADGRLVAVWPLDDLREVRDYSGALKLSCEGGEPLARLELPAGPLADEIRRLSPRLNAHDRAESVLSRTIVLWSLAATVSLLALGLYGIPALADRIAPMLPWSADVRMGAAVEAQLRRLLPIRADGPFECGGQTGEAPGRKALDALAKTLSDAAALPVPIRIVAVRSDIPNALALPGGAIYLFDGLIDSAAEPEEIAGVLAHEIGHVATRDGARRALQSGGVSLLFGFFMGDFVGGAAAVGVANALSQASYSRVAETGADHYAVGLMTKIGADPRSLGDLLVRLAGEEKDGERSPLDYLASHPATAERKRAIDAETGSGPFRPVMDHAAFSALKRICGEPK